MNRETSNSGIDGKRAFSLVEVLAAVAIIGVVVWLAIPNIVRVKEDSEFSLAESRLEALNVAMASYVQALGATTANANWVGAADDEARYDLIQPYIAFAPEHLNSGNRFMPDGYDADLPGSLVPLTRATYLVPEE